MTENGEERAGTPDDGSGERPDRFTWFVHIVFGGLAGVLLFLIMMVTVVDVVGRYVFDSPLPGGFELTQIMMAVLIYIGLPSVSRQEEHVTIDLLDPIMPDWIVPARQAIVNLIGAIALGVFAWQLWLVAARAADYGDVWEYLPLSRAPVVYVMAVLSGVASLALLVNVVRYLRGARHPAPGFE